MPAPKGNTYAKGNKGGGRPTVYLKKFCQIAYKMCQMGATDADLAEALGIGLTTLDAWKKKHQEFSEALKKGKAISDAEVANSLYQRAVGYSHADVDIKVIKNKIVTTKLTKHYPPDTTAAIFWLKNRQKQQWRDKQEYGITDKDGNDVKQFDLSKLTDEELRKLAELQSKSGTGEA